MNNEVNEDELLEEAVKWQALGYIPPKLKFPKTPTAADWEVLNKEVGEIQNQFNLLPHNALEGVWEKLPIEMRETLQKLQPTIQKIVTAPEIYYPDASVIGDVNNIQALSLQLLQIIKESTCDSKKAIPKVAYLPDPYDRKETETADKANNKVTHGIALAIVSGGKNAEKKVKGWRENTVNKHPLFPCNQGRDEMTVYLEPEGYNAAELWAKVHNLDALTLDVYLAILAFICDPRNKATYPHVGWFTVNPQQIADLKAFRRYGNDRRVLVGKIVEAIHTISDLRTNFRIHWPGTGKKEQNRMATESGCRLIHIGGVTYLDQGELFEHPEQFPKEDRDIVGISLFIGKWGNYWLQDGERYYWIAAGTRLLLQLGCSKGDEFAKKIGALLLTVEGGTDSRNKTLEFTIAELLERIRELLAEEYRGKQRRDNSGFEETREGKDWARRTEEYLQAGLTTLLQMGILASYNFSSDYPSPGDRGTAWSERWLSARVYLTTPEAAAKLKMNQPQTFPAIPGVPEHKRRVRGLGKTKKPLARGQYLDAATVAAIYEAYKERNWTQQSLARELKIARPTLSNVLNRREAPSVELAKRIRAFLEKPIPECPE